MSVPGAAWDHRADLVLYSTALEREERFKWSEVRRGILNLQVWFTATAYFAILAGLYSFGLFVSILDASAL